MSELQTEREEESKKHYSGVEIMAARMSQHEEKMEMMSQTLAEIKTLLSELLLIFVSIIVNQALNFRICILHRL